MDASGGGNEDDGTGREFDNELEGLQNNVAAASRVVFASSEDGTPTNCTVRMVSMAAGDGTRTKVERGRRKNTLGEKASKTRKPCEYLAEIVVVYLPKLGCQTSERS